MLSVDLYEISLTSTPANADTRILSAKSKGAHSTTDRQKAELAEIMASADSTETSTKSTDHAPISIATFEVA